MAFGRGQSLIFIVRCVLWCVCLQMRLLPVDGGVREGFIFHFLHHLKLKALALSKYVDAEP